MPLTILIWMILLSFFLSGPETTAWNVNCNENQDAKAQQARSSALLYAHRCFLKDVPIPIPAPLNTIPELIVPSHVVVPRCSGNTIISL